MRVGAFPGTTRASSSSEDGPGTKRGRAIGPSGLRGTWTCNIPRIMASIQSEKGLMANVLGTLKSWKSR